MLHSEFDRLIHRPYTEDEFEKIHYIYCYYPGVETHKDIATIWDIGGIRLIEDMMERAKDVCEAESAVRKARIAYEQARDRLDLLLKGN